jgi:hypothetical protein
LSWRGKAGAYAKSGNIILRDLSNRQKLRYFNKYADSVCMPSSIRNKLIDSYQI